MICDVEAERTLSPYVQGADAVVFAAGAGPDSGPERKRTVDLTGAVKLIEAGAGAAHPALKDALPTIVRREFRSRAHAAPGTARRAPLVAVSVHGRILDGNVRPNVDHAFDALKLLLQGSFMLGGDFNLSRNYDSCTAPRTTSTPGARCRRAPTAADAHPGGPCST